MRVGGGKVRARRRGMGPGPAWLRRARAERTTAGRTGQRQRCALNDVLRHPALLRPTRPATCSPRQWPAGCCLRVSDDCIERGRRTGCKGGPLPKTGSPALPGHTPLTRGSSLHRHATAPTLDTHASAVYFARALTQAALSALSNEYCRAPFHVSATSLSATSNPPFNHGFCPAAGRLAGCYCC